MERRQAARAQGVITGRWQAQVRKQKISSQRVSASNGLKGITWMIPVVLT